MPNPNVNNPCPLPSSNNAQINTSDNNSNFLTLNLVNNLTLNNSNKKKLKKIDKLKVLIWNPNKLYGKFEGFNELCKKKKPDIIGISELKCNTPELNYVLSRLNEAIENHKIKFKYEYVAKIRKHENGRENNNGGGSAILIRNDLVWSEVKIAVNLEAVGVQIRCDNMYIQIFNWYYPPSQNEIDTSLLSWISSKYKNYLIIGDLNAHTSLCKKTNKAGESLINFIHAHDAVILNEPGQPTSMWRSQASRNREAYETNNILDLFIGTEVFYDNLLSYKVLSHSEVDIYQKEHYHVPVVCEFSMTKKLEPHQSKNPAYNVEKADWECFKRALNEMIPSIDSENDALAEKLEECIVTAAKKAIPLVKKTKRKENLPQHIVDLKRLKNYWQRRYNKSRDERSRDNLYALKDAVKNELYQYESNKIKKFMKKLGSKPLTTKPLWKRVNRLRGQSRHSIPTLYKDNIAFESDFEKAKLFGDRMREIFNETNTQGKFDDDLKNHIEDEIRLKKYEKLYNDKSIPKIKFKELNKAIARLNNKSTPDASSVSNLLIKKTSLEFRRLILVLFNNCLEKNILPEKWKISYIKMIEKKADDLTNPKNYRPISITACLCRLLERIILRRLQEYLENNGLLMGQQSGFRARRSTSDNLVFIIQKIKESFNRKRKAIAIFFDIEAAFDKVWHAGLIHKMAQMRVPYHIVRFVTEFLSDRSCYVKVNQALSEKIPITCGVPQGACLSPTLFAIFINDSPKRSKRNDEQTLLFADDTALLKLYRNKTKKVLNEINCFLSELSAWAFKWRVTLAPHKCNYIAFGRNKVDEFDLSLNGTKLKTADDKTDEIKFLGLRLDKHLSFQKQVEHLKKTCYARIDILKVINSARWHLLPDTKKLIYHLLIRSVMEYASFTFHLMSSNMKSTVNAIHHTALRIIYNKDKEFGNANLLKFANDITMEERLSNLKENYLKKAIKHKNPLICQLIEEYKCFRGGHLISVPTVFCESKVVDDFIGSTEMPLNHLFN